MKKKITLAILFVLLGSRFLAFSQNIYCNGPWGGVGLLETPHDGHILGKRATQMMLLQEKVL